MMLAIQISLKSMETSKVVPEWGCTLFNVSYIAGIIVEMTALMLTLGVNGPQQVHYDRQNHFNIFISSVCKPHLGIKGLFPKTKKFITTFRFRFYGVGLPNPDTYPCTQALILSVRNRLLSALPHCPTTRLRQLPRSIKMACIELHEDVHTVLRHCHSCH